MPSRQLAKGKGGCRPRQFTRSLSPWRPAPTSGLCDRWREVVAANQWLPLLEKWSFLFVSIAQQSHKYRFLRIRVGKHISLGALSKKL